MIFGFLCSHSILRVQQRRDWGTRSLSTCRTNSAASDRKLKMGEPDSGILIVAGRMDDRDRQRIIRIRFTVANGAVKVVPEAAGEI